GMDWQDEVFQPSPMQMYDFSLRGGSMYTQYAVSGSLFNNEGIILNTGATRRQGRISLNHTFSDRIKTGIILNYAHNSTYGAQTSTAATGASSIGNSIFYNVFGYRPVFGTEDLEFIDDDMESMDPDVDDQVTASDPNSLRVNPVKNARNIHSTS